MKMVYGDCFGKNIQFVCERCQCVYEAESRKDWTIRYKRDIDFGKYEIPEYSVKCPNCGFERFLGYDSDDLKRTFYENTFCSWMPLLKERADWNERYKVGKKRDRTVVS